MFGKETNSIDKQFTPPLSPFEPSVPTAPKPKMKTTGKMSSAGWLLIIVLFLLVASGAMGGYYLYLLANSPQRVLEQAIDNLKNLKSGTIQNSAEITFQSKDSQTVIPFLAAANTTIKFEAKVDFINKKENFSSAGSIKVKLPDILLGMMGNFEPKLDFISTDSDTLFINISGLPQETVAEYFNDIQGKWLKLDLASLQSQYKFPNINIEDWQKKQAEVNLKMLNLYKKYSFLVLDNLKTEAIDGQPCHHYKFNIDKNKFSSFTEEVMKIYQEVQLLPIEDTDSPSLAIDDFKEKLSKVDMFGEIWVTKKDKLFKKARAIYAYRDDFGSLRLVINSVLSNYNKGVNIAPPAQYESFAEILQAVTAQAQAKANNATVVADVKQLQTAFELYFNDHSAYPFPPIGGNRLGADAMCLSEKGFEAGDNCEGEQLMYMRLIPSHPNSPVEEYRYYLCNDSSYIINFRLGEAMGSLQAGRVFATPDGIKNISETDCIEDSSTSNDCIDQELISHDCLDNDSDGLSNYFENKYGTDSSNKDSDGDGFFDGAEVMGGYNPNGAGKLTQ
ncbi:MAG: hypothetical protein HY979_02015 [Candidatus Magasanikbacteria bacterium]|nr:hypothetical protein [Candidatus Magasanikbacteria bacterium]